MELVIDKFILHRPSYKDLGVPNEVSTILTKQDELDKMCGWDITTPGFQTAVDIIKGKQKAEIANWDIVPLNLVGVIGHEAYSTNKKLYSIEYFKNNNITGDFVTDDLEYKLSISASGRVNISNFDKLVQDKVMCDFAYNFNVQEVIAGSETGNKVVEPAPVNIAPGVKVNGTTKYMKGRVLIPSKSIKSQYQELLVKEVSEFTGSLESSNREDWRKVEGMVNDEIRFGIGENKDVKYMPYNDTTHDEPRLHFGVNQIGEDKPCNMGTKIGIFNNSVTFDSPIFMNVLAGMEYLENDVLAKQAHIANITDSERQTFGTDNTDRILACKIALGLIEVPL